MALVVSAPGKVILFGDHSVVHNRRAIAAAISLRTTLSFSHAAVDGIILDFPDIQLHLSLPIAVLSTLTSCSAATEPESRLDAKIMGEIDDYLNQQNLEGVVKAAAGAFIYLYVHIGIQAGAKSHGTYHITSELPIGAGLGSSATVSVVIVTTLLLIAGTILAPSTATPHSKETLELINKWAYVGEQCIHGTPSGVDNTVATYGKAVAFQKTQPMEIITVPELPILLTDTGVPRSTKTLVAHVGAMRDTFPLIVEPILDAMHQIAIDAQSLLTSKDFDRGRLGSLMVLNQGLLGTLGVSHPSIETIVALSREKGWTKLIGAGGGGCTITLLKPEYEASAPSIAEAEPDQFKSYIIQLGGVGVGYHTSEGIQYW